MSTAEKQTLIAIPYQKEEGHEKRKKERMRKTNHINIKQMNDETKDAKQKNCDKKQEKTEIMKSTSGNKRGRQIK